MPILVKSDDIRSGRKAKARHGRLGPAWESMGKGNLAETQPKNHQNAQKTHFLQKVPGVNGLSPFIFIACISFIITDKIRTESTYKIVLGFTSFFEITAFAKTSSAAFA